MPQFDTLTWDERDHVVAIGLNRPRKRNAFNVQMLRELAVAYAAYEDDAKLWCAVLYAHGDHFTAGLDLAEVGPKVAAGEPLFPRDAIDPLDLHGRRRTKPVVCAVQGWCLTIGIELLLASDIRLATTGTRFGQIEVKRGIMPFGGATLRLPQVAGWGNAMQLLLTGDEFGAETAHRFGVVQDVVAPEDLFAAATEVAERVAKQAPLAVQASRRSAQTAVERGTEAALATMMDEARKLMRTSDAAEGLQSFVERREANFQGR